MHSFYEMKANKFYLTYILARFSSFHVCYKNQNFSSFEKGVLFKCSSFWKNVITDYNR